MNFGYDVANDAVARCLFREYPEVGISAAVMLHGYGSVPPMDAAYENNIQRATDYTAAWFLNALEHIANSEGKFDPMYIRSTLSDAGQQANRMIRTVSESSGQAIYISGAIGYFYEDLFLLLAFGGSSIYILNNGNLRLFCGGYSSDGLIRNAIGSQTGWTGEILSGVMPKKAKVYFTTAAIEDCLYTAQQIENIASPSNHTNTISMFIRRNAGTSMDAVMEIRED